MNDTNLKADYVVAGYVMHAVTKVATLSATEDVMTDLTVDEIWVAIVDNVVDTTRNMVRVATRDATTEFTQSL